jgi:integrase/recombinase XerD
MCKVAADIADVQEWIRSADKATMRIYDRRKTRPPEDSPIFKIIYKAE